MDRNRPSWNDLSPSILKIAFKQRKQTNPFSGLSLPLARPLGSGELENKGFGWVWARRLRRKCAPGPWARARALARPGHMHFSLNIQSQAHPHPSISGLPAPGGRASGRPSSKKEKRIHKESRVWVGNAHVLVSIYSTSQ